MNSGGRRRASTPDGVLLVGTPIRPRAAVPLWTRRRAQLRAVSSGGDAGGPTALGPARPPVPNEKDGEGQWEPRDASAGRGAGPASPGSAATRCRHSGAPSPARGPPRGAGRGPRRRNHPWGSLRTFPLRFRRAAGLGPRGRMDPAQRLSAWSDQGCLVSHRSNLVAPK